MKKGLNAYTSGLPSQTITGATGGIVTYLPNTNYNSGAGIVYTNATITFDGNNQTNPQFFITAGSAITFSNVIINYINGALPINIFWLAGTQITFTDVSTINGNLIAGTADITFTNTVPTIVNGYVYTAGTAVTFDGPTLLNAPGPIVCYVKGTNILTKTGYKLIEDLQKGDNVISEGKITNSGEIIYNKNFDIKPITWIGNFKVTNLTQDSLPICIKTNALGKNSPFEDLYVSPGHRIIIKDKMVLAKDLVNGTTIFQDYNRSSVEYYHFESDEHAIIIANNVLSETYLEMNTRYIFENKMIENEENMKIEKINLIEVEN